MGDFQTRVRGGYTSSSFRMMLSRVLGGVLLTTLPVSQSAWTAASPVVPATFLVLGWLCLGVGVVGRIWCALYIVGRKTFSLVTDGPYSLCRNPLYLFSLLGGIGAMFLTERLSLVVLFVLCFSGYFPRIMRREELSLRSLHGERFERYRATVPAFWPDFHGFREPTVLAVSPDLFRRFLLEVVWFIWIGGGITLLQRLQEAGVLFPLLRLY